MISRVYSAFGSLAGEKAGCLQACDIPEFHIHDPHPVREGKGPCCILTTGP